MSAMNRQPEPDAAAASAASQPKLGGPGRAIEAYLDRLCAQLEALPLEARDETRRELRQHLESLVAMRREPERIIEGALHQFGEPERIGQKLALEWEEGAWNLSGLPLRQRIGKIREAAAQEAAAAEKQDGFFKIVVGIQSALLLLYVGLSMGRQGAIAWLQLSFSQFSVAQVALLSAYAVVGLTGCALAWQAARRRALEDRRRALNHLIQRGGMAVLIPAMLLAPGQGLLIVGLMLALCFISLLPGFRSPSPRARVVMNAASLYGLVMGGVISTISFGMVFWFGGDSFLWLLMLPAVYFLGRRFWKLPVTPTSRKMRAFRISVVVLIAGVALTQTVTNLLARQKVKNPRTPAELVESWRWNGAYLAGDTDVAFLRAHPQDALPALRAGLRHWHPHVRMETANAIEGLGTRAAPLLPDLEARLSEEDDEGVRLYLAMTFGGIGNRSKHTLQFLRTAFARERNEKVKIYLAGSLARLTAPRFDAAAWQWLLKSLQPPRDAGPLSSLSSGGAWERCWAAAYALGEMGAGARPALPALRRLNADAATPWWVRKKLQNVISRIDSQPKRAP